MLEGFALCRICSSSFGGRNLEGKGLGGQQKYAIGFGIFFVYADC
jgi:hypothetical protein